MQNKGILFVSFLLVSALSSSVLAQQIDNPGFEQKLDGWQKIEKTDKAVQVSNESKSGTHSLKIVTDGGSVQQKISLLPNTQPRL